MNYKAIVSSAMMALVITGCSPNDKEDASENLGLNRTNQDNLDNPMNVSDTRQNVNDDNNDNGVNDMRVSEDISNRVEALKGVSNASVIVTENNAYVGAVLKTAGIRISRMTLKKRLLMQYGSRSIGRPSLCFGKPGLRSKNERVCE